MWSRKERKIWTDCKQGLHCSCQRRVPKKEELVFVVRETAKGIGEKGKNKRKRGNLGGERKEEGSKKKEKRDCIEKNTKNSAIWGCNLRKYRN